MSADVTVDGLSVCLLPSHSCTQLPIHLRTTLDCSPRSEMRHVRVADRKPIGWVTSSVVSYRTIGSYSRAWLA